MYPQVCFAVLKQETVFCFIITQSCVCAVFMAGLFLNEKKKIIIEELDHRVFV